MSETLSLKDIHPGIIPVIAHANLQHVIAHFDNDPKLEDFSHFDWNPPDHDTATSIRLARFNLQETDIENILNLLSENKLRPATFVELVMLGIMHPHWVELDLRGCRIFTLTQSTQVGSTLYYPALCCANLGRQTNLQLRVLCDSWPSNQLVLVCDQQPS